MVSYHKLKILLAEKDLSKKDLQQKLRISTATLAKFERSEPVSLRTIEKICIYLDCNIEDVVTVHKK